MILTASETHRNMGIGLTGFIALSGVVSEFVVAFQCGTSDPWLFLLAQSQCLDMVRMRSAVTFLEIANLACKTSFWRGMAVINILTDLSLILFPVHVIITLQMSMGKKITILVFFGARSL